MEILRISLKGDGGRGMNLKENKLKKKHYLVEKKLRINIVNLLS